MINRNSRRFAVGLLHKDPGTLCCLCLRLRGVEFCQDLQLHVVAHDHAAGLRQRAPLQAVIEAIQLTDDLESGDKISSEAGDGTVVDGVERDLLRNTAHRKVSSYQKFEI